VHLTSPEKWRYNKNFENGKFGENIESRAPFIGIFRD